LVAVAYDTMCRREELVSLLVKDIAEAGDGSGSILIRRSKTDTTGEGATAYLSPLTMRPVGERIKESGLKAGPIFVRVHGATGVGTSLTPQNVMTILRKVGQRIGLERERVGEDFRALVPCGCCSRSPGVEHGFAIRDAGRKMDGHEDAHAVREKVLAGRGAMARAAKSQGRA
jgi:integrase